MKQADRNKIVYTNTKTILKSILATGALAIASTPLVGSYAFAQTTPNICQSITSDADNDGWGWENGASCMEATTTQTAEFAWCTDANADPDGNGWGWENNANCLVEFTSDTADSTAPNCTSESADSDGDGWGWENEQTCIVDTTDYTATMDDAERIDIFDTTYTARSADCADYVNTDDANVMDLQNSIDFNADVIITADSTECTITSNSVPNHNFNDDAANFSGGCRGRYYYRH